jgi:predicted flap endonuclease-1-like 5' DNA nuclease
MEAALARGMERSQAVFRHLDMPEPVRAYFTNKNAFHVRSRVVRAQRRALAAQCGTERRGTRARTSADAANAALLAQLKGLAVALLERYAGEDVSDDEEGDDDAAGEDASDDEEGDNRPAGEGGEGFALYRLRGPAVRRAHKAGAMAQLRAWLLARAPVLPPAELTQAEDTMRGRRVLGVDVWPLVEDVLTHQSRERVWQTFGVCLERTAGGSLVCVAQRAGAPAWAAPGVPGGAPAEHEHAADAPEGAAAAPPGLADAQARLGAWLDERGIGAALAPHLRRVLGVWRLEQLPALREADLLRVHAALPYPGLLAARRRLLLDGARQLMPQGACAVCHRIKTLAVNTPCGCAAACAACTRDFRAGGAAGAAGACIVCHAPSDVVEPPDVECPVCLNAFTPAEMFALQPCGHQLCVSQQWKPCVWIA